MTKSAESVESKIVTTAEAAETLKAAVSDKLSGDDADIAVVKREPRGHASAGVACAGGPGTSEGVAFAGDPLSAMA